MLEELADRVAVVRQRAGVAIGGGFWSFAMGRTITEGAFQSPELATSCVGGSARADIASRWHPHRAWCLICDFKELKGYRPSWTWWMSTARNGSTTPGTAVAAMAWLYRIEGRRLRRLEHDTTTWARDPVGQRGRNEPVPSDCRRAQRPHRAQRGGHEVFPSERRLDRNGAGRACSSGPSITARTSMEHAGSAGDAWPEILRRRPGARLLLVGRRPVPEVRRLAKVPGVEVVGQVPDVRPYVARAAVIVVPLRLARGIQNKVLEALAMGKATVASPSHWPVSGLASTVPVVTAWTNRQRGSTDDDPSRPLSPLPPPLGAEISHGRLTQPELSSNRQFGGGELLNLWNQSRSLRALRNSPARPRLADQPEVGARSLGDIEQRVPAIREREHPEHGQLLGLVGVAQLAINAPFAQLRLAVGKQILITAISLEDLDQATKSVKGLCELVAADEIEVVGRGVVLGELAVTTAHQ